MRRQFTAIEYAHLAISMMKLAFSNREAAQQAEQWIIEEAKAFIPLESNTKTPQDEGDETSEVNKPPGLWDLFD